MTARSFIKALLRMLRSNLSLKIAAIIFAVILWMYVIAETNPLRPIVIDNVPVTLESFEQLKQNGLMVSEDIADVVSGAQVRLEVRQKEAKLVNAENVKASIDFSKVTKKGKIQLKINAKTEHGVVMSVYPSTVTVTVDDYVKNPIPVKCQVLNGSGDYYIGAPTLSPDVIEIMGARTDVSKAVSALCTVDLSGITTSFNQSLAVTLLDDKGKPLDSSVFVENLPSVIAKIEILPKKQVPVIGLGSIVNAGKVKQGYEITGISFNPEKIEIAGEKALLDTISEVYLQKMDVAGAAEDVAFNVKPEPIEGVRFIDVNEINAVVHISQKQAQRVFTDVSVAVENLPKGLKALLGQKTTDVTVAGGIEDLSSLKRSDIRAFIDLKGYAKGVYSLSVQAQSISNSNVNISFSPSEIKVTIQ
jgi:YbbR domain-containing protein